MTKIKGLRKRAPKKVATKNMLAVHRQREAPVSATKTGGRGTDEMTKYAAKRHKQLRGG